MASPSNFIYVGTAIVPLDFKSVEVCTLAHPTLKGEASYAVKLRRADSDKEVVLLRTEVLKDCFSFMRVFNSLVQAHIRGEATRADDLTYELVDFYMLRANGIDGKRTEEKNEEDRIVKKAKLLNWVE